MNKILRREIFERLAAERPDPVSELNFRNSFELLIAVMLSAQATDKSVNAVTPALFQAMPDAETMAQKTPEEIEPFIKSIGLYRNKAKHAAGIARELVSRFNGRVPQTAQELTSLPGVGEKTAKVVLNVAFGKPTIAVDTHIFRVSKRLKLAKGTTPAAVAEELEKTTPPEFMQNAHHCLLLHGRYCCTARNPKCGECPVCDLCNSADKRMEYA